MSRSTKKTKIQGIASAQSEKKNKQDANRKFRRILKQKVNAETLVLPAKRELSNVWCFDKDGKRYKADMTAKELRK